LGVLVLASLPFEGDAGAGLPMDCLAFRDSDK
jgi:hypothetical protein